MTKNIFLTAKLPVTGTKRTQRITMTSHGRELNTRLIPLVNPLLLLAALLLFPLSCMMGERKQMFV